MAPPLPGSLQAYWPWGISLSRPWRPRHFLGTHTFLESQRCSHRKSFLVPEGRLRPEKNRDSPKATQVSQTLVRLASGSPGSPLALPLASCRTQGGHLASETTQPGVSRCPVRVFPHWGCLGLICGPGVLSLRLLGGRLAAVGKPKADSQGQHII